MATKTNGIEKLGETLNTVFGGKPAPKAKAPKASAKVKAKAKGKAKAKAATPARAEPAPKVEIKGKGLKTVAMRAGSKQAAQYGALLAPKGATRDELCKLTGFTPGTQMSALHGSRMDGFMKKMGGKLISESDEKRGTVYRIVKK